MSRNALLTVPPRLSELLYNGSLKVLILKDNQLVSFLPHQPVTDISGSPPPKCRLRRLDLSYNKIAQIQSIRVPDSLRALLLNHNQLHCTIRPLLTTNWRLIILEMNYTSIYHFEFEFNDDDEFPHRLKWALTPGCVHIPHLLYMNNTALNLKLQPWPDWSFGTEFTQKETLHPSCSNLEPNWEQIEHYPL